MTSLADDLLDVFMEEAAECLERLHGALEVLERERSHDAVVEIRRDLHTFKGGARMCGLRLVSELAHAGESLAAISLPDGDGLPPAAIRLLFVAEYELRAALQRPAEGPGSDDSLIALTEQLRTCDLAGIEVAAPDDRADYGSSNGTVVALTQDAGPRGDHANGNHTTGQEQESADVGAAAVEPSDGGGQLSEPAASVPGGLAAQLLEVFVEEAGEMLDMLHACLESLEQRPDEAAMAEARRAVHTIKGGARMCGKGAIADLAHACEDVIGRPAPGNSQPPTGTLPLLFEAEQGMREALAGQAAGADGRVSSVIDKLRGAAAARTSAVPGAAGAPPAPAPAGPAPSPVETRDEVEIPRDLIAAGEPDLPADAGLEEAEDPAAGTEGTEPSEEGPRPVSLHKPQLLARPAIPPSHNQSNRVAVDLEKVEALVAKVTEIVANRTASHGLVETLANTVNEMARAAHRLQAIAIGLQFQISSHGYDTLPEQDADGLDLEAYGPIRQLLLQLQEAAADQQALVQGVNDVVARKRALAAIETRLDTELQSALLNMRLLPLSQLRVRLDQVVRTSAAAAHREVRWTMEGHDVALDKYVCDRLFEPLMHLLRNCVDHGIEPPGEREAAGKPRVGRITVRASVEGNQAVVVVSDDGKGIDPEKVAQVAVARGLIDAERAASLSTREKMELVFRPGFSTAKEVTELSGRGMGMEIVREACTRMGGTVSIGRRESGGTIVVLQVPLSMAVVHCIVVRDAGRHMAIPATQVAFVQLVPPMAISKRHQDGYHVRVGTSMLRLFFLPPNHTAGGSPTHEFEERTILVVPYRGERVALAVDEIVEEEDQIVKPLPHLLQSVDRLLGAVILGDGTPVPVLNLVPLLDLLDRSEPGPIDAKAGSAGEMVVLVVDDSLTMRLALSRTLEHAGFTVETARDGQDALEHVRAHGLPHLVTLDIEMPRMDGLETLYAIRHLPGGERVPIFMLSSRSGRKHLRTAEKMGATRYFTKPYHDTEFVAAVREATGMAAVR